MSNPVVVLVYKTKSGDFVLEHYANDKTRPLSIAISLEDLTREEFEGWGARRILDSLAGFEERSIHPSELSEDFKGRSVKLRRSVPNVEIERVGGELTFTPGRKGLSGNARMWDRQVAFPTSISDEQIVAAVMEAIKVAGGGTSK